MKNSVLIVVLLISKLMFGQITPSSGEQGEYLSVSISTTNIGLVDFSGSTSQFRFSQVGVIPSMETQAIGADRLSGNVNISSNQNVGFYDIEVYDYNTNSWVTSPDLFEVTQAPPIHSISPNSAEQGNFYLSVLALQILV